jgi:hypothetical protein
VKTGKGKREASPLSLPVICRQLSGSDAIVLGVKSAWSENLIIRDVCHWWNVEVLASFNVSQPDRLNITHWENGLRRPVALEWTRCNYGGARAWLICPGCGRRVAILYGDVAFACRFCRQLAYDSQRDSAWHRSLRRARAVHMKLGGSANLAEPLPQKPKGMHRRTYRRLYAQAEGRERVFLAGTVTMLTTLEKTISKTISRLHGRGQ